MIVTLTPELLRRFYGSPTKRTIRGFAFIENDEVKGVFGLFYDQPGERWGAFCEVRPEIRARLHERGMRRAVLEASKHLRGLIARTPGRVQAAAALNIPSASGFLERIGFEHVQDEVYQWPK